MMKDDKLYTVDDLADYLDVSRRTVYRLIKSEKMPGYRIGGHMRFKREAIDNWLESKKLDEADAG